MLMLIFISYFFYFQPLEEWSVFKISKVQINTSVNVHLVFFQQTVGHNE